MVTPIGMNDEERARITSIWERMAEDFRPFDVDVTTVDPSVGDPDIFVRGGRAQRVVFTSKFDAGVGGTGLRWYGGDANGAATDSWYLGKDTPAWVFSAHALAGEIGSHEVGHAVGLSHDSAVAEDGTWIEYRGEHGSGETRWSPIMGQGNGLSQWSNGTYPGAANQELDIGILTQALGRRADDFVGITELPVSPQGLVDLEGVIETAGDTDLFALEIADAVQHVELQIAPWHNGPNLDIGVTLMNASGAVLVTRADEQANPVEALDSSLDLKLARGTYYLQVQGVGKAATKDDPGYSDYGSLGYYRIHGTMGTLPPPANELPADFDGDQDVDFADFLILSKHFGRRVEAAGQGDVNGDAVVDHVDWGEFVAQYHAFPSENAETSPRLPSGLTFF